MDEIKGLEKWMQHYSNQAGQVSSFFLAANTLLISAFVMAKGNVKLLVAICGVIITLMTLRFNLSFRRLNHFHHYIYSRKIEEKASKTNESDSEYFRKQCINNRIHEKVRVNQWYPYVLLFWVLNMFWIFVILGLFLENNYLSILISAFVSIPLFLWFYYLGLYKRSAKLYKDKLFEAKKKINNSIEKYNKSIEEYNKKR